MIKKILLGALVMIMVSCSQGGSGEQVTKSGYTYSHTKTSGQKINDGDFVYFAIKMVGSDGNLIQELADENNLPVLQLPTPENPLQKANPIIEIFQDGGSIGDSITLIMPIDSLPNKNAPGLEGLDHIKYVIDVREILSETEYKAKIEADRLKQEKEVEEAKARLGEVGDQSSKLIDDYNSGKLDVQTTEDGLKYVILDEGEGTQAATGKRASVHYYGALLDGNMFDTSFRGGKPFTFTIGRGEVIQGWDKGIPLLKKGGKAALFIPYTMAYGEAGSPPRIPQKADLMFYVELVDVN